MEFSADCQLPVLLPKSVYDADKKKMEHLHQLVSDWSILITKQVLVSKAIEISLPFPGPSYPTVCPHARTGRSSSMDLNGIGDQMCPEEAVLCTALSHSICILYLIIKRFQSRNNHGATNTMVKRCTGHQ